MSQRCKLRLGDGTIRLVAADELHAWLGDANAMVQTLGSYRWSPRREFIAEEPALPLVSPQPREGEASPDPAADDPGAALAADAGEPLGDRDEEPPPRAADPEPSRITESMPSRIRSGVTASDGGSSRWLPRWARSSVDLLLA
jgi:hypothetical protein